MITIEPVACEAVKMMLQENRRPFSIAIEIRSSGCCDPVLGIAAEAPEEDDLVYTIDNLTVAVPPEIDALVGDITISYVDDSGRKGFLLVSQRPLNEWAGFTTCGIRF